jgi:hypothetical protein
MMDSIKLPRNGVSNKIMQLKEPKGKYKPQLPYWLEMQQVNLFREEYNPELQPSQAFELLCGLH